MNENDISLAIEEGSHFVVGVEPIKTLAAKHFNEKSLPQVLQEELVPLCKLIAKIQANKFQRNAFLSAYLETSLELATYGFPRGKEKMIQMVFFAALAEKNQHVNGILNSDVPKGKKIEDMIESRLSSIEHLCFLLWIKEMARSSMMTYVSIKLFGLNTGDNEDTRRYKLLVDEHIRKTSAELLLKSGGSLNLLAKQYDFTEMKNRSDLLARFRHGIESGQADEIDATCEAFVSLLQKNYDKMMIETNNG